LTRADIEQLLARQKAGFLQRDAEALAACHTIDGTFESPAYGVVQGRDAIRDVYRYWYRAFPDMMLTWESHIIDPPRAAYFWTLEGTAEGPFFGDVRPGSRVTMTGASECLCTEHGIAAIRHVFDFSGGLLRAGVLKVKPA
jgi:predicted ester cyclase